LLSGRVVVQDPELGFQCRKVDLKLYFLQVPGLAPQVGL
jgi:hypothetical protein